MTTKLDITRIRKDDPNTPRIPNEYLHLHLFLLLWRAEFPILPPYKYPRILALSKNIFLVETLWKPIIIELEINKMRNTSQTPTKSSFTKH